MLNLIFSVGQVVNLLVNRGVTKGQITIFGFWSLRKLPEVGYYHCECQIWSGYVFVAVRSSMDHYK